MCVQLAVQCSEDTIDTSAEPEPWRHLWWRQWYADIMYIKPYGTQVMARRYRARESLENPHDPFAVAIVRSGVTVGHVPRKISSIVHCSFGREDRSAVE